MVTYILILAHIIDEFGALSSFEEIKNHPKSKIVRVQLEWCEITQLMSELLDPHFNNLTSACLKPLKTSLKSQFHQISIHDILPTHSIKHILDGNF